MGPTLVTMATAVALQLARSVGSAAVQTYLPPRIADGVADRIGKTAGGIFPEFMRVGVEFLTRNSVGRAVGVLAAQSPAGQLATALLSTAVSEVAGRVAEVAVNRFSGNQKSENG